VITDKEKIRDGSTFFEVSRILLAIIYVFGRDELIYKK